jgi:hypothetical protein
VTVEVVPCPDWNCRDGMNVVTGKPCHLCAGSVPSRCPTCGSDDRERYAGACLGATGPVALDLYGHLIMGEPDPWHGGGSDTRKDA